MNGALAEGRVMGTTTDHFARVRHPRSLPNLEQGNGAAVRVYRHSLALRPSPEEMTFWTVGTAPVGISQWAESLSGKASGTVRKGELKLDCPHEEE